MDYILEALKYQDKNLLLEKANYLKQTDGEGWAIGELVERVVREEI
jgi:hypothetical protein